MNHGGGPVDNTRAAIVERLRARREEVIEAIFARVSDDVFGVAGADDAEYVAGLHATVAAAVDHSLQGIEHGEDWTGPIPAVALEQAGRAARVGVSLDTVLRRYVVGNSLLGELALEEADRGGWAPDVREVLRGVLRAQASVLDRLLEAITAAYGDELVRIGRSPERRRCERIRRLLEGAEDVDGGEMRGAELGYDLVGWHLGAIAVGEDAPAAVRGLAVSADRRLLSVSHGEQGVWAWLGGRQRFAVGEIERAIAGASGASWPEGVVLALGEPAQGVEGWRLTHQQAQAALVVGLRRGPAQPAATRYGDVALLASALKDELLGRALIDIYIAPLQDSRGTGPVLCETLRAYVAAERNVSSAAAALGVVRKTVDSRLRTIEQRLGRSLHPCPAELEVALELDEIGLAPLEPGKPGHIRPAPAPPAIPITE
jgi:PucR-like helix-turn-helix protein/diguanylate cyclase with GGDEF domain